MQTNNDDRILVLAATNRPFELDDAALRLDNNIYSGYIPFMYVLSRRFPRRIYIQLPDRSTRIQLLKHLLLKQEHDLTGKDFELIAK